MRRLLVLAAALAFGFSVYSDQAHRPKKSAVGDPDVAKAIEPLRTPGDRPIDIQNIRLDLNVDLKKKTVHGLATIDFKALQRRSGIELDAVDFEIKEVKLTRKDKEGFAAPFEHDGKRLAVDVQPPLELDEMGTVIVRYRVREPRSGLNFFGPTEAEPDVPWTVWSQGQAVTNRYWFPCLDQPNERQTTELVVTVDEGFEVLSNGKLIEKRVNAAEKTTTFHWKQGEPHVAYLVSLVVGQFDIVEEEWNKLPVLYYVPKGRKDDVARTFGRTREMLTFFSRRFGIDYPWEKYAQVVVEQFSHGGMENTSATTLTDRALHDERAMLDSSPDGLIAHELAHQWWGDLVTCRDWAHTWLNEGFATYCDGMWFEHKDGPDDFAIIMMHKKQSALNGGKERPIVDRRYPTPWSMFDARAYPKGAWVLHMLRDQLGEETFWKGIQRYGTEHRLQCVETSDFRKVLEKVSGRDLERFFHDWTERPGHPVLHVHSDYQQDARQLRVRVKQRQDGEAFHFPLTILCQGEAQAARHTVNITEKEHEFFLPMETRPCHVEIDPRQTLLAELEEEKSREWWARQLRDGSSVISRIRAAEHLSKQNTPAQRDLLLAAFRAEKFWGVQSAIARAMGTMGGETCRDELIEGLKHIHPKVRRACAQQLGNFPGDAKVGKALKECLQSDEPSYFVQAAALEAYAKSRQPDAVAVLLPWLAKDSHVEVIRAAALDGLGQDPKLTALDTIIAWTKRGKPRAARIAALRSLGQIEQRAQPTEEQRRSALSALTACLDKESTPVRVEAVTALREMGRSAKSAAPALEAMSRLEPNDRIRDLAKKALDRIRDDEPMPAEVSRLREEIERLREHQNQLRDRLEKYERVERKGVE